MWNNYEIITWKGKHLYRQWRPNVVYGTRMSMVLRLLQRYVWQVGNGINYCLSVIRPLGLVIISTIVLSSCGVAKQTRNLSMHHQALERMVMTDEAHPEQKMDTLASSLVQMMDEALRIVNPKKGARYVQKYADQNTRHIEVLLADIGQWQKSMSTGEKIGFGLRALQKPYTKDLIELIPRFERKYQQVKFISKFSKKIRAGLVDAGLKELGI